MMKVQTNPIAHTRSTVHRLIALCALIFMLAGRVFAQEPGSSIKVDQVSFPVMLSDGNTYYIVGYLYYQGSYHNRTLQVALHGGNYNHTYWDVPPINGHEYSYARYMAQRHYAVLAIDQLGTGASSKPDGDFLTLTETASGIHQVLAQLRSSENALGYAFDRIVLVGHSLGSINGIYAQATYHDADALITTGLCHVPHDLPIPQSVILELSQHTYFPFPDALREQVFYYTPDADPDVIAYDRSNLADLLTRGQLVTGIFPIFDPEANGIGQVTGPVLVQLGEHDALFPAALAAGEAAFYTSAASVTVQSLPNVGHDVNTHLDNQTSWQLIDTWLSSVSPR